MVFLFFVHLQFGIEYLKKQKKGSRDGCLLECCNFISLC